MPVIELQSLRKDYGGMTVMDDLDLRMEDGEFTVLVGPSGCGKSTTLRMLAGLEDVTDGAILIDGRDVTDLDPKERDLAMVFQDYALYPHMNVAKNMSFALRLQRMPKAEIDRRVTETAGILGLADYLRRKPAELSGGQRQRVAMGRALVRDAATFLFDEPLSNLDAKLRGQMREELALMRQRLSKNMVYVTHDQIEAMTLGDRIVVMRGGKIMQQGTPEELFTRPANLFVAGFIGSPPMNFLPARIAADGGRAEGNGFAVPLATPRPDLSGREVTVGLRPSAVRRAEGDETGDLTLKVGVSEYVGAQTVAVGDLSGNRMAVEIASTDPVRPGDTLHLTVMAEQVHLFDPKTEAAIKSGPTR